MRKIPSPSRISLCFALGLFLLLWLGMESDVLARAGGANISGGRGFSSGRSYQRSAPSQPQQRNYQQSRPQQQPQPASPFGGMGRGILSGMAGGLLGGFLGSMLFRGTGFAGGAGWGGGGFGFGDIFLLLIILGVIYFIVKAFRSRKSMQMSAAGSAAGSYSYPGPAPGPAYSPPPPEAWEGETQTEMLRHIQETDPSFSEKAFKDLAEDIFFKIQGAWTRRDLSSVRHLLSPEMLAVFQKDVNNFLAEKQVNRLENIAVREVEIFDASQDRGEEFVTVKFYANLLDYVVDEDKGQVLSGSPTDPVKFLEYWTFSRSIGEKKWVLAGITQESDR